jgi:predicted anti-sigma-YlaC factor YlaD
MTEHLNNETLIDYMHAGLAPEQDAQVYAHLEVCNACRSEYDSELALTDMLRNFAAADQRELPSVVKAEIWERIRSARPSRLHTLAEWFRPAIALPIAAGLALAVYLGTSYLGPHGPASIEAAYYLEDHAALNSTVPFSDRATASAADLESNASKTRGVVALTASYTADANP